MNCVRNKKDNQKNEYVHCKKNACSLSLSLSFSRYVTVAPYPQLSAAGVDAPELERSGVAAPLVARGAREHEGFGGRHVQDVVLVAHQRRVENELGLLRAEVGAVDGELPGGLGVHDLLGLEDARGGNHHRHVLGALQHVRALHLELHEEHGAALLLGLGHPLAARVQHEGHHLG